jgi:hypothetical protein
MDNTNKKQTDFMELVSPWKIANRSATQVFLTIKVPGCLLQSSQELPIGPYPKPNPTILYRICKKYFYIISHWPADLKEG